MYKKLSSVTPFLPFVKEVNKIGWSGLEFSDMNVEGITAKTLRENYVKGQTLALVLEDDSKLFVTV